MKEQDTAEGMLSPYRILDLTDEKGLLCGRILGDLGADVIKIERPGGDPARSIGPFYHDEADPEKSLFWFAFNASKRGITLDIETASGQDIFRRLVKTADLLIESFPLGYMGKLGLEYSALEKINPGIILVSISPFGQTGPYKDYKAPDIVAWAMGGMMYVSGTCGETDRPPVRISHHAQSYLQAGGVAAEGAMLALYHREMTGEGQQVDISIQDSVAQTTYQVTASWDMMKVIRRRGEHLAMPARMPRMWPCKDGYVMWYFYSGAMAAMRNQPLVEWMDSEGMADDFLKKFDWTTFNWHDVSQETLDPLLQQTAKFFISHTKAELLEGALKHRTMLYPVSDSKDLLESAQLASREFWVELEHPELDTTITYPGAFAKTSETPPRISRRAPLIGEHNPEIYEKELGLSSEELLRLKQSKVI